MRKLGAALGVVFVVVLISVGACVTWGPFHGLGGADWLRFWGGIIAPLILGTTASAAAVIAWLTLQQNRAADVQRYERERRAEFWERLEQAISLGVSSDLVQASLGADLLSYIYDDLSEQRGTRAKELELIVAILATVQEGLEENRRLQEQEHQGSSSHD